MGKLKKEETLESRERGKGIEGAEGQQREPQNASETYEQKNSKANATELVSMDDGRGMIMEVAVDEERTETSLVHPNIQIAAAALVITDKARLEIVKSQVIQFCELLSIKLRSRLTTSIAAVNGMQQQLTGGRLGEASGAAMGVNALNTSITMPLKVLNSLASGGGALLAHPRLAAVTAAATVATMYGVTQKISRHSLYIVAAGAGASYLNQHRLRQALNAEISRENSFIRAMESTGRDEIQVEQLIRDLTQKIGLRYVNQIVKLSKEGQTTLSEVIVKRIYQNLSGNRVGYESESTHRLRKSLQHFSWSLEEKMDRLTMPADRVRTRQKLSLVDRCLRAIVEESVPGDSVSLGRESYFGTVAGTGAAESSWTASGVLSKTGMIVDSVRYIHELTEHEKYGYCFGDIHEARRRKMMPFSKL